MTGMGMERVGGELLRGLNSPPRTDIHAEMCKTGWCFLLGRKLLFPCKAQWMGWGAGGAQPPSRGKGLPVAVLASPRPLEWGREGSISSKMSLNLASAPTEV